MQRYVEKLKSHPDVVLEEDEVTYETFEEFEEARERSEKIDGAVVVAVSDGGRLLLVQNDWMDGYGFPGGGVEPGEDWERAAEREVKEETGVDVDSVHPWRLRHSVHSFESRSTSIPCVFYHAEATDATISEDPGVDEVETIEDVQWFDTVPEEAVEPDRIREALEHFA